MTTLYVILGTFASEDLMERRWMAVIELDRAMCQRLIDTIDRVKVLGQEMEGLASLDFWDSTPEFGIGVEDGWEIPTNLLAAADPPCADTFELEDYLDDDHAVAWASKPPLRKGEFDCRTECDRLCVWDAEVHWEATPKHTSITVETHTLSRETLTKLLKLFDEQP